MNPGSFKGNTFYEWQVQTKARSGITDYGPWSNLASFYARH